MRETRRTFFVKAVLLSGSLAFPRKIAAQNPPTPPPKPQPGYTPNPAEIHSNSADVAAAKRARLLENEKGFREGVDRLFQLSSRLREELQKTPTADVFSLRIVKQTEEIEKLAKLLKAKAKAA